MPVPVLVLVLCWLVQYMEIHVPRYEGLRQLGFYTCFLGGKSWGYLALRFAMLEGSSIKTADSCNCNCIHTCSTNWPSTVHCSAVGVPSETRDISVSSGSSHLSSLPAHYTFPPLDFLCKQGSCTITCVLTCTGPPNWDNRSQLAAISQILLSILFAVHSNKLSQRKE